MPSRPTVRDMKNTKEEDDSSLSSNSRKRAGRTRISAACEACKRRKTKCTGEPLPCQSCQLLGTECVIDLSLDMRRREAMQQTIQDLKSYQDLLNGLIDCVRDGSSEVNQTLRELFRQPDVSTEDMSAAILYWAQTIKAQTTESGQEDSMSTVLDTPRTPHKIQSPSTQNDTQSTQWALDPSLRTDSTTRRDSKPHGFLAAMHRRLKESSETEAVSILEALLKAKTIGDVEFDLNVETHTSGNSLDQGPRSPWQLDNQQQSSLPQLVQQPSLDHSRSRELAGYLMGPMGKNIHNNDHRYGVPGRPQERPFPHTQGASAGIPKRVIADLLVANDGSGSHMKVPVYLVQPLLIPDDSSMSRVYTDYLNAARHMLTNKVPVSEIIGSTGEIALDLLFRERQDGDKWDCASWACDFYRGFEEFDFYVRLAGVFMLTRLMQWLLVPSAESYAKLPHMIRPSPSQCMVPHVGSIDLILIPCIRDAAIENFRDWLTPLAGSRLTVNWPHFEDDAMVYNANTNSRYLTQRFIDHVSEYSNWSVGAEFLDSFPEVAGRIRIHT